MIPPIAVRTEPEHVQKMYIREFERVEEQTGSALAAKKAADRLLYLLRDRYNPKYEQVLVTMTARITEMSAESVLPNSILSKIKEKHPHPFFAVYDVGGEGVSTGRASINKLSRTITKRKLWSFKAIKSLARRIKDDAASVIIGHDSPTVVGKVIHAFNQVIGKTLHALAVVHIIDDETIARVKTKELDTCSIEGNVTLARSSLHSPWYIKEVEEISKLALANSALGKPGFFSAGILATIQELEKKEN